MKTNFAEIFNRLSTIQEVLDWVAEARILEERRDRLLEASKTFPSLKQYLYMSFSDHTLFDHIGWDTFPAQKPVSKIPNRQEIGFEEFFTKNLIYVTKERGGTDLNKRSKLIQIMDYLDPRDFHLIKGCLMGEFSYTNSRINEMLLTATFPDMFPNA